MIDSPTNEAWVQYLKIIEADVETKRPQQTIFRTLDGQNFVYHIADVASGYPYIVVEGDSIAETVERIYSLFPTYSREDVFRMVRHPKDFQENCVGVLYLGFLGLCKETCDPEILELFQQSLLHKDPRMRNSTLYGMGYPIWPEFQDLFQAVAENDPDETVRQTASYYSEGLKAYLAATENKSASETSVDYDLYKYQDIFYELILPIRKLGLSEAETAVVLRSSARKEPLSEMLQPFADQIEKQLQTLLYSRIHCYEASITHATMILDLIAHPQDSMTWIEALSGYVLRLGNGGALPMTMTGAELIAKRLEIQIDQRQAGIEPQADSDNSSDSELGFTDQEYDLAKELLLRERELASRWERLKMTEYGINNFADTQEQGKFFNENIMRFWNS
jgi:hypothetical protein